MTHITNSNLVAFLYELARDHVPVGTIEKIVRNSECSPKEGQWALCTKELGQLAEKWTSRLCDKGSNLPQETDKDGRTYEDDLAVALEKCVEVISDLGFDKHRVCLGCKARLGGIHAPSCATGEAYKLASEVLNRPDKEAAEKEKQS